MTEEQTSNSDQLKWLMMFHQLPPKPAYFRVKVWRRLQAMGAVNVKNSVYVLPLSDAAREDLSWLLQEITHEGGEAAICEVAFIAGVTNQDIIALFHEARREDYEAIIKDAEAAQSDWTSGDGGPSPVWSPDVQAQLTRFRKRIAEVRALDFFASPSGVIASRTLEQLESVWKIGSRQASGAVDLKQLSGRTWVTRTGIQVDRIASSWLIRRFIDPRAKFKFVDTTSYVHAVPELRFDMNDAEFTHIGDMCTFEVLVDQAGLSAQPALKALAEIVHDIDLKDGKYGRAEATGIAMLLDGIVAQNPTDLERLARGSELFENMYRHFGGTDIAPRAGLKKELLTAV